MSANVLHQYLKVWSDSQNHNNDVTHNIYIDTITTATAQHKCPPNLLLQVCEPFLCLVLIGSDYTECGNCKWMECQGGGKGMERGMVAGTGKWRGRGASSAA